MPDQSVTADWHNHTTDSPCGEGCPKWVVRPTDPFDPANYNEVQFTQLTKIYDALMTLIQLQSPIAAQRLQQAHAAGTLVGPSPLYTGEFLYDTANAPKTTADIPK